MEESNKALPIPSHPIPSHPTLCIQVAIIGFIVTGLIDICQGKQHKSLLNITCAVWWCSSTDSVLDYQTIMWFRILKTVCPYGYCRAVDSMTNFALIISVIRLACYCFKTFEYFWLRFWSQNHCLFFFDSYFQKSVKSNCISDCLRKARNSAKNETCFRNLEQLSRVPRKNDQYLLNEHR